MGKFHGYTIPAAVWTLVVKTLVAEGFVVSAGCNLRQAIVAAANKVSAVPSGFDGFKYPTQSELKVSFYPAFKEAGGQFAAKGKVTRKGTRKSASAASPVTKGWKHPETGQHYTGKGWWLVKSNYEKRHAAQPAVSTAQAAVSTAQAAVTTGQPAGRIIVLDGTTYAVIGDVFYAI